MNKRILIITFIFELLIAFTANVWALVPTTKISLNKDTQYRLNISYLNYFDRSEVTKNRVDGATSVIGFGLNLNSDSVFNFHEVVVEAQFNWSTAESYLYHNLPNLYASYEFNKDHRLTFGRKKMNWSVEDEVWRRGLWAPRTYHQITEMKEQAFLGAYYEPFRTSNIQSTIMLAPIFIPDIGIKFELENNQFVANNPNFKPPRSVINTKDQKFTVSYDMVNDDPKEILFHPSLATQLKVKVSDNSNIRLQAAYKPMNQIALEAPITNGIAKYNTLLHAKIRPQVYYHTLLSSDYTYNLGHGLDIGASATMDRPEIKAKSKNILQKKLDNTQIYSGYISKEFALKKIHFLLGYTYLEGGDRPDRGEFAAINDSQFPMRFDYTRALRFMYKQNFHIGFPVEFISEATYDFRQKVSVLKMELGFKFRQDLVLSLKAQDISLLSNNYSNNVEHYWHSYLDTDSVSMGVNYVF